MPDSPTVTVLVAHGSRNPDAATAHEALCGAVARAAALASGRETVVVPAYLEIAEPSIPDTIDRLIDGGATRVRLLPHFLGPGNHVQRDLPAIVAEAGERHPGVAIELAEHLGADPGLVDLLAARVLA